MRRSSLFVVRQIIGREVNICTADTLFVGNRRIYNVVDSLFFTVKRYSFKWNFVFTSLFLLLALLFYVCKPIFWQVWNEPIKMREAASWCCDSLAFSNAAINMIMLIQFVQSFHKIFQTLFELSIKRQITQLATIWWFFFFLNKFFIMHNHFFFLFFVNINFPTAFGCKLLNYCLTFLIFQHRFITNLVSFRFIYWINQFNSLLFSLFIISNLLI